MRGIKRIQQHLADRDPRLAEVMEQVSPPKSSPHEDIYFALLQSIVSQQLSVHAAATIFDRFLKLFPKQYPAPRRVMKATPQELRSVGLSGQKARYLQNVAEFALSSGISHAELDVMSDEEVIEYLTEIKGVGRWTVEMLLLFPLDRPDVFAVDDLGIQQAMTKLYRLRSKGPALKKRMLFISERWRPYRSVACKYLWKWKGEQ